MYSPFFSFVIYMAPKNGNGTRRRRFDKRNKVKAPVNKYRNVLARSIMKLKDGAIVPDVLLTKLRYSDMTTITSTSGIPAVKIFRGNSITDPSVTDSGHQPLGRDQWSNFYSKYLVYSSRIKVMCVDDTSATTTQLVVVPKTEQTFDLDMDTQHEKPYTKFRIIPPNKQDVVTVTNYMTTKKMLGLKDLSTQNSLYTAEAPSNPTNGWFWHVGAGSFNELDTSVLRCRVMIEYYVAFFDRKPLSAS